MLLQLNDLWHSSHTYLSRGAGALAATGAANADNSDAVTIGWNDSGTPAPAAGAVVAAVVTAAPG